MDSARANRRVDQATQEDESTVTAHAGSIADGREGGREAGLAIT